MRLSFLLVSAVTTAMLAAGASSAGALWTELAAKRAALPGLHQEFTVTQSYKTANGSQGSERQIVLDIAADRWREKSVSGSGSYVRIFDGKDLFYMEEDGDEFERIKRKAKDPTPIPRAYAASDPDWSKAKEAGRRPCGFSGNDHQCVVLEAPLKKWTRNNGPNNTTQMLDGVARIFADLDNGMIVAAKTLQNIQTSRGGHQVEQTFTLKRFSAAVQPESLFQLPAEGLKEVKELSQWNAAKIKKQLAGKPAPAMVASDIHGKPVDLAAFKGRTVLLDFWTTWCPPCRADGPALDKLYKKYGDKELMIVGVSVSEERAIVEKFLKDHPHSYPVVLTTENEMPRAYQLGVFPTYIVIDEQGNVTAALEGDQGFAGLRGVLKKAGLEVN